MLISVIAAVLPIPLVYFMVKAARKLLQWHVKKIMEEFEE